MGDQDYMGRMAALFAERVDFLPQALVHLGKQPETSVGLKCYFLGREMDAFRFPINKEALHLVLGKPEFQRHSGLGVAIVSEAPPYMPDHQTVYSIHMWKETEVGGLKVPKNIMDSTLAARKVGKGVEVFPKTSDMLCTTDLQILALEAKLWEQVVLGSMTRLDYAKTFVDPFTQ